MSVAALHWISAAFIGGLAVAGFVMADLPEASGARLQLSRLHSVGGLSLMVLTVARLVVRLRANPPAPLPLTDLHRRGVAVVHGLIYAVIFGIGASGALTGARSAWPEYLRGELAQAPALGTMASREVHEALVFMLVGLVLLHVAGMALQHVRRGGVLQRMVPFLK
ncbi:MAG: cytochrome b/b6 domain-containing protein [Myxococcales bacterium]|nr:cytochrome b/b6 domain-containing protein [Myxococcales bacterium]